MLKMQAAIWWKKEAVDLMESNYFKCNKCIYIFKTQTQVQDHENALHNLPRTMFQALASFVPNSLYTSLNYTWHQFKCDKFVDLSLDLLC